MIHVLIIVPYPELVDKTCKILDIPKYKDAIDATIQLMTVDKVDQRLRSDHCPRLHRSHTFTEAESSHPSTSDHDT